MIIEKDVEGVGRGLFDVVSRLMLARWMYITTSLLHVSRCLMRFEPRTSRIQVLRSTASCWVRSEKWPSLFCDQCRK